MRLPPELARRWLPRLLSGGVGPPGDPVRRRQATLLGAFLLVAIVVFAFVDSVYVSTVPGYVPPWYGYAFLVAAWLLNQRGHYRAAASVTLAMFPLVIFTLVVLGSSAEPQITLCYFVLGILLASILLSWRGVTVFTLVSLGGLALMPLVAPSDVPSWSALVGPFSVITLVAGLALVFMRHRDLLERDRQAELRSLIHELELKNEELERFTYTVSHDLKSPLVTIRGFLPYVAEHAAAGRIDSLRQDLGRIVSATDRMHQLLDELLRLSRVGRVGNPSEDVALPEVAEEVVSLARTRLDERGIKVEIAPDLPVVHADRLRLVELFQNLVDNAIRFMGEETHPLIRVGWRGGDGCPVVFVQDNGVGIEAEHHERVFGLFDQLDPRTDGTGVGLALSRRIIDTHGGRIWIESQGRGRGTAVCFTLPGPGSAPTA